ncbi:MAG: hypothetical protein OXC44_07575 [Proteobacteria bacterium]|nr:hypothetical protein [Pseudomonadota bacterium]
MERCLYVLSVWWLCGAYAYGANSSYLYEGQEGSLEQREEDVHVHKQLVAFTHLAGMAVVPITIWNLPTWLQRFSGGLHVFAKKSSLGAISAGVVLGYFAQKFRPRWVFTHEDASPSLIFAHLGSPQLGEGGGDPHRDPGVLAGVLLKRDDKYQGSSVIPLEEKAFADFVQLAAESEHKELWAHRVEYFARLIEVLSGETFESILQHDELQFLGNKHRNLQDMLRWSYVQYFTALLQLASFTDSVASKESTAVNRLFKDVVERFKVPAVAQRVLLFDVAKKLSQHMVYKSFSVTVALAGNGMRSWHDYAEWAYQQLTYKHRHIEDIYYLPILHHLATFVEQAGLPFKQFKAKVSYVDSWKKYHREMEPFRNHQEIDTALHVLMDLASISERFWSW